MSLHPRVPLPGSDFADGATADLVSSRQNNAILVAGPDGPYVVWGEAGRRVPSTDHHVVSVVDCGAGSQMVRVDAVSYVAGVQDVLAIWDRADEELVRPSVGVADQASVAAGYLPGAAVATPIERSHPNPASVCHHDVREVLVVCDSGSSGSHMEMVAREVAA